MATPRREADHEAFLAEWEKDPAGFKPRQYSFAHQIPSSTIYRWVSEAKTAAAKKKLRETSPLLPSPGAAAEQTEPAPGDSETTRAKAIFDRLDGMIDDAIQHFADGLKLAGVSPRDRRENMFSLLKAVGYDLKHVEDEGGTLRFELVRATPDDGDEA